MKELSKQELQQFYEKYESDPSDMAFIEVTDSWAIKTLRNLLIIVWHFSLLVSIVLVPTFIGQLVGANVDPPLPHWLGWSSFGMLPMLLSTGEFISHLMKK